MSIFDFLAKPLGILLNVIYQNIAFRNYGLAIILFTIATKLILLPSSVKQQRVALKMNELKPQMDELQRKYQKDREKLNLELMKMYKENNVNPAGGCLPIFIQIPILFALYSVIARPLTYMLGYTAEHIAELAKQLGVAGTSPVEIAIVKARPELINMFFPTSTYGINLGEIPAVGKGFLWLIPAIAVITTYLSIKINTPKNAAKSAENSAQSSMLVIFPVMTGIISFFQLPAGLGLYWIASNVFQIFQQGFIKKLNQKEKEAAKE